MSRRLDDLCPRFRSIAESVIARCVDAGLPVLIVESLRTPSEQAHRLRSGSSATGNSLHLPQTRCGVCCERRNSQGTFGQAHALDLVPYDEFVRHGGEKALYDRAHPGWSTIGAAARAAGAKWGGDWPVVPDPCHVEDSFGVGRAARIVYAAHEESA